MKNGVASLEQGGDVKLFRASPNITWGARWQNVAAFFNLGAKAAWASPSPSHPTLALTLALLRYHTTS